MNPDICLLISIYDTESGCVLKCPVVVDPNKLDFDLDDTFKYFKEDESKLQDMLPDEYNSHPVVSVEEICIPKEYRPLT